MVASLILVGMSMLLIMGPALGKSIENTGQLSVDKKYHSYDVSTNTGMIFGVVGNTSFRNY